ncbi:MAG: hypothetical protein PHI68_02990 [Candidatus Cloacimonetes bacterium]|nr:hypothetical protein [Candidatus Cloacimonadota bacterium]
MVLLVLAAWCGVSCTRYKYIPVKQDHIVIENGYSIIRTDSLIVAIRPEYVTSIVTGSKQSFFAISILVRNRTSRSVNFHRQDISIFNGDEQFDPIPIDFLMNIIGANYRYEIYPDPFAVVPQEVPMEKYHNAITSVANNYYSFGLIAPNARKEGLLFFSDRVFGAASFEVRVQMQSIKFTISN